MPGERGPVYATSLGKAILAYLDPVECDQVLDRLKFNKLTSGTITDVSELREDLARIRARGYAINNMERQAGVRSVAAPILDASGHPVASVCAAAPSFRLTLAGLKKTLAPHVMATADEISRRVRAALPALHG